MPLVLETDIVGGARRERAQNERIHGGEKVTIEIKPFIFQIEGRGRTGNKGKDGRVSRGGLNEMGESWLAQHKKLIRFKRGNDWTR